LSPPPPQFPIQRLVNGRRVAQHLVRQLQRHAAPAARAYLARRARDFVDGVERGAVGYRRIIMARAVVSVAGTAAVADIFVLLLLLLTAAVAAAAMIGEEEGIVGRREYGWAGGKQGRSSSSSRSGSSHHFDSSFFFALSFSFLFFFGGEKPALWDGEFSVEMRFLGWVKVKENFGSKKSTVLSSAGLLENSLLQLNFLKLLMGGFFLQ
jgi:hypothetical protein